METTYRKLFRILIDLEPALNPSQIMVDFEKAALNALEDNFLAVISGCFFTLRKTYTANSGKRVSNKLSRR